MHYLEAVRLAAKCQDLRSMSTGERLNVPSAIGVASSRRCSSRAMNMKSEDVSLQTDHLCSSAIGIDKRVLKIINNMSSVEKYTKCSYSSGCFCSYPFVFVFIMCSCLWLIHSHDLCHNAPSSCSLLYHIAGRFSEQYIWQNAQF